MAPDPGINRQLPYHMLGGEQAIRDLAREFYKAIDDLGEEVASIRRMHGDDLSGIEEKLFKYLSGWLGGPALYFEETGSVCLTEPHAPYGIGERERDQWLLCMERALERLDVDQEVREMLREPLFNIADFVRNQ